MTDEEWIQKRRTRVVFPNVYAARVWGILASLITAWILGVSTAIVHLNADVKVLTAGCPAIPQPRKEGPP